MKEKPQNTPNGRFWLFLALLSMASLFSLIIGLPIVASVNGADIDFRQGFAVMGQIVCIGVPCVILSVAFVLFADWLNSPS